MRMPGGHEPGTLPQIVNQPEPHLRERREWPTRGPVAAAIGAWITAVTARLPWGRLLHSFAQRRHAERATLRAFRRDDALGGALRQTLDLLWWEAPDDVEAPPIWQRDHLYTYQCDDASDAMWQ